MHCWRLWGHLDLADPRMTRDGMHLTAKGNRAIAEALAAPVTELAGSRAR
jgi:lysophospholipase L1-like esterase